MVDDIPTVIYSVHGGYAMGAMVADDLTLEPCFIAREGDFFAHGESLREAVADARSKYDENRPLEERIASFRETFPTLDSISTGAEFFRWHHVLTGSCQAGRQQFCRDHGIDLSKEYSVRFFLELTSEAFGSSEIKQTLKAYEDIS